MTEIIQIKDLKVHYPIRSGFFNRITDHVLAVDGVDFMIEQGKTYGLVGESGSGKSTTGKAIIGLEKITNGEIIYQGQDVTKPRSRKAIGYNKDVQMIFQDSMSSLNPKKRVLDIIAEPIRNFERLSDQEEKKKVKSLLDIVGMPEDALYKYPHEFSGGQRQRVALGRAIVRDAKVFLMDEPLSNLDAKLRVAMRAEIAKLHQRLETTTIYVTHDQTEAMTMADRIVIMKDGFIQQIGSPKEVYNTPKNMFVAGFIGSPAMNFFKVTLNNGVISNQHGLKLAIPEGRNKELVEHGYEGKELIFGIRPEDIHSEQVALTAMKDAVIKSEVVVSELLGAESMLYTKIGDTEFISKVDARDFHHPGEMIDLAFDINKGHFFDPQTEEVIK